MSTSSNADDPRTLSPWSSPNVDQAIDDFKAGRPNLLVDQLRAEIQAIENEED